MFETIKNAFGTKEIRVKIWATLLLLLVYRIGCFYSFAFFCFALLNRKFTENGAIFALYCVVDTGNERVMAVIYTIFDGCQFFQHIGKSLG